MTEPYGYDETTTDDQDDDSGEQFVRLPRKNIRTLERDAKTARKDRETAERLTRENTLLRTGLGDLSERQQRALFASIDGDFTAESARAAAEELGFVKAPEPAQPDPDQAALERMSSTGESAPGSAEDPLARLQRAAAQGQDALLAQIQADGNLVTPAS